MKIAGLISFVVIPFLFACLPKKPEIPLAEIPAGPFVQALEQQRLAYSSLKVVASAVVVRSGRKLAYDTVGIVLDGRERLRIEAFGPLGQSLIALVWNRGEVLLRRDDGRVTRPGEAGWERALGLALDGAELCEVLSGTIPPVEQRGEARAFQGPDGAVVVEFAAGDAVRRIYLAASDRPAAGVRIKERELLRAGKRVYRAFYGEPASDASFPVPGRVTIENPGEMASITLSYEEVDLNAPLNDEVFTLTDSGAEAP